MFSLKMYMCFRYNPCIIFGCFFLLFSDLICIDSVFIVTACPYTILYRSFWNFAQVFSRSVGVVVWCKGVLCSLLHRGVQLILACSWARLAILVAGWGRGGMFLFLLFLYFHSCSFFFPVPLLNLLYYLFFHPCPSLKSPLLSLLSLFSLSLGDDTKWPTRGVLLKPQHNQSPGLQMCMWFGYNF